MMADLPRIAVGTTQSEADSTAMLWALMDALAAAGIRVQSFLSRAYFPANDAAVPITGQASRPLDSWLMCHETCRNLFVRGCGACDLALVEGSFVEPRSVDQPGAAGGSLATLCEWLDLPSLAIVDARRLAECCLPQRPRRLDGLLLDGVRDESEACRLQTQLEAIWKAPVLGWLGPACDLRRQIGGIPFGGRPDVALCRALGQELARHLQLERIVRMAAQRPLSGCQTQACTWLECSGARQTEPLRVAVACDDAFGGYFPDTLELLEARGAVITDFSPLRDDRLPHGTDVVYVGCGHPELFAEQLAGNDCMTLALKNHLCSGRRLYAECGGLAYLCHEIEMPDGTRWPMVGALPVTARFHETQSPPRATELTLVADTWLGQSPLRCRGYLSPRWTIAAHGAAEPCVAEAGHESDVVHRHQAIGSRMYLDFAAHQHLLDRFFQPHGVCATAAGPANPRADRPV
jgi:cobyrinic acid a,c-diamide synthase